MGRHGYIRVEFAALPEPQMNTVWALLEHADFFDYFHPRFIEYLDTPLAIKDDQSLESAILSPSETPCPGERPLPRTALTITSQTPDCRPALQRLDQVAHARQRGYSVCVIGNVHTTYCTATEKCNGPVFRACYRHRDADGRTVHWRRAALDLCVRRLLFRGPPRMVVSVRITSATLMCWPDSPHPNLPPSVNRPNWSRLLKHLAKLADKTAAVSSVDVDFQKLRGNIPASILDEARQLPKIGHVEG